MDSAQQALAGMLGKAMPGADEIFESHLKSQDWAARLARAQMGSELVALLTKHGASIPQPAFSELIALAQREAK